MNKIIIAVVLIVIVGFAAMTFMGGSSYDTNFPLPEVVRDFAGEGGDSQVIFKTDLSIDEVLAFYRAEAGNLGLSERELLTVQSDTTLNLVFDGHSSGQAMVIQVVDLGDMRNVTIRLEEI